ncbi:transposase [Streptomyces caatingaensis]|uniref:transposase n=1 Tax=Streptomyces caatingaensis TaxID=1678637 RepID=UPI000D14AEAF|nr:transposase [Streptomyces caatingaensis]
MTEDDVTPPALPDHRPATAPRPAPSPLPLPGRRAAVLTERLVPDDLWLLARTAIPAAPRRPQGGGQPRADDRDVLAAIVFLAGSGCSWRQLPPVFGASWQTVHRRFTEWTHAGLWDTLCAATADRHGAPLRADWTRTVCHHIRKRAGLPCTAGAPPRGDRSSPAPGD